MSDDDPDLRTPDIYYDLEGDARYFICPECHGASLPFDHTTECSKCGAHFHLHVEVVAPGIGAGEDDE